ncbi:hypothetical protein [Paenibacillus medicaginis]|uniref:Uncharacterized protein n=1 Tax=Paenibacillus medicaginis TaxID=1470560 RepID=A0ABV5C965_9BACL
MSNVIPFPSKKSNSVEAKETSSLERAMAAMENRLGVSIWDYLHFTGDPEKTSDIVERNMKLETLRERTRSIYGE